MKIERSREWWLERARTEGDFVIGAGRIAIDPEPERALPAVRRGPAPEADESRIAFGRFVNLMRRQRGLSMERLADEAGVDLKELLEIEDELRHTPEPRTVYQLARLFDVPQQSLNLLAGLSAANDDGFHEEAVRFAARSESVQKLTPEETSALRAFIAVLAQRDAKHPG